MTENGHGFLVENRKHLDQVLTFFASAFLDEELDRKKFAFCEDRSQNSLVPNHQLLINSGWYSLDDFFDYYFSVSTVKYDVIEPVLEIICERGILLHQSNLPGIRFYKPNSQYFSKVKGLQNVLNHLLGFDYVVDFYRNSVVKLEGRDRKGNVSLGTGFFAKYKSNFLILTNRHVVENQSLKILSYENSVIEYDYIRVSSSVDVACVTLSSIEQGPTPFFWKKNSGY